MNERVPYRDVVEAGIRGQIKMERDMDRGCGRVHGPSQRKREHLMGLVILSAQNCSKYKQLSAPRTCELDW